MPSQAAMPRFVIVGSPGSLRVEAFREALAGAGLPPAEVVSYPALAAEVGMLQRAVEGGAVVRIESPDRDFEAEKALIAAGADVEDDEEGTPSRIGRDAARRLEFDRGRILHPRQWYLGFRATLREIARSTADAPSQEWMNTPDDIGLMFDKARCHAIFEREGVPCPPGLGRPRGYDDLRAIMGASGVSRAFVKLAHGSSASGIVAIEAVAARLRATTTVEVVRAGGGLRLYNSRAIRVLHDEREVAEVVDALCLEGAHAERWVPKAGLDGETFDLRVLVIAGRAAHVVVRSGPGPLTNLHLGNRRGDVDRLRARMPAGAWEAAMGACEAAAAVVPGSLYAGVDLVILPGYRRHAVLEINAFGDLLPRVSWRGMGAYSAEIVALLARRQGEEAA